MKADISNPSWAGLEGVPISFSITGDGTLSSNVALTDANGIASAAVTGGGARGKCEVTATIGTHSSTENITFTKVDTLDITSSKTESSNEFDVYVAPSDDLYNICADGTPIHFETDAGLFQTPGGPSATTDVVTYNNHAGVGRRPAECSKVDDLG